MKRTKNPDVLSAPDWREHLKRGLVKAVSRSVQAKIEKAEDGTFSFVASTASPDRYGDTIDQRGWNTEAFEKNPVLLWAHSHSTPPVGKVGALDKSGDLTARGIEFTPEEVSTFGAEIGRMVATGFLSAVSVGFLPKKWEERRDPETGAFLGYHFVEMELLELSVVPVPANPQALALRKSFASHIAAWASEEEETPIARAWQNEVNLLLKAAEEIENRKADEEDANGFSRMIELLERIAEGQERNTAELAALRKALTDHPTKAVETGGEGQPLVSPPTSGEDGGDLMATLTALVEPQPK